MSIKVLHIQSFDWGGAAKAALRLHNGLLNENIDSNLLLKWKSKKDTINVFEFIKPVEKYTFKQKLNNKYNQYKKKFFKENPPVNYLKNAPEGFYQFTIPNSNYDISCNQLVKDTDIIHLHWVADFIDYKSFFAKINKPVVWTMHDMNPFTGGCHYSLNCKKYETECYNCPQLQGTVNPDYAYDLQNIKVKALSKFKNLHIVTPSQWLSDCSVQSKVLKNFSHYTIPNGFNCNIFKKRDKQFSRDLLGLPQDKRILLFVAGDISCKPKGYEMLQEAFKLLGNDLEIAICAIGEQNTSTVTDSELIFELGTISDDRLMSVVYSAADVFVTPSLADNLPNTVVESLLCGTPVIGFPIGGITQMIEHNKNGVLCKDIDTESLKDAIVHFFKNPIFFDTESIALEAQSQYNINLISSKYRSLYENILTNNEY